MKKYKYIILQGCLTEGGNGDLMPIGESYSVLANAKKFFNKIKKDATGYNYGILTTQLVKVSLEDHIDVWEETLIIEQYELDLRKK